MSAATTKINVAALEHLVEAAAALTKLTAAPQGGFQSTGKSVVVEEGRAKPTPSKKRDIFPQKLMAILNDASLSDVISWLPHGRSFVIIRPDVFTEEVLPKYLPPVDSRNPTKYPSFTRKLNRW